MFSVPYSYGWQILGPMTVDRPPPNPKGDPYIYKIDCDVDKIRRFIVSVLWRASVSKNPFDCAVKLGPYEAVIKERLFDSKPLLPEEFPTTAMILETGALEKYDGMLFPPSKDRMANGPITHTLFRHRRGHEVCLRQGRQAVLDQGAQASTQRQLCGQARGQ